MDSKKIGKLIYDLRIKNKLTQKELADKLLVTSQAISKWENGRGIPDIEMLQRLSEIFNIDISELLSGNLKPKKENKKNKFIIILPLIITIIIFLLILILIKMNDTTEFKISKLASDNDLFNVKGIIAYNNNKKSIYISKVEYSNSKEEKEYLNLECILYEVNGNIEKRISKCDSNNNQNSTSTLSELLNNVELNVDDYSCSCSTPVCNKLYLKINATTKNKEIVTYSIPIELENNCNKTN